MSCECRFPNNQNFYLKVWWENMLWGRGGWASNFFVRFIHFLEALFFSSPACPGDLHFAHDAPGIELSFFHVHRNTLFINSSGHLKNVSCVLKSSRQNVGLCCF